MEERAINEDRAPGWVQRVVIGRSPKRTLVRIVVTVVLVVAVSRVIVPIRVQGISMLPTYHTGTVNFVNRFAYLTHEPRRGDVVAVRMAGMRMMLLKRVIGLPGERIAFRDGEVYIDGQPLAEPYLKRPCDWTLAEQSIEQAKYFVVGDNRSMAPEEHEMGKASRERIVGKVLL